MCKIVFALLAYCLVADGQNVENRCNTPYGNPGYCVEIGQCAYLRRLIQDIPTNPRARTFLQQSLCWYGPKEPVVCCAGLNQTQAKVVTESPRPIRTCGVSAKLAGRVVGGMPAKLGDFPWMAVLGYKSQLHPGTTTWSCGGTLVSSRHVVTAAHCIDLREDRLYLVRLGELDLERDDDGASPTDVSISRMIKHPEYARKNYTNDIGLLTLAQNVSFNSLLSPICLPAEPEIKLNDFVDYNPFVAGWGDTDFRGPQSMELLCVQMPVVANEQCREAYLKTERAVIDERVLCAGYEQGGNDSCRGDSGGPLMVPMRLRPKTDPSYYLIGVVSYGHKICGTPGYPGVYTRVTYFLPWLQEEMSKE